MKMQYPHFFSQEPPDVYRWLYRYLCKEECSAFPCIPSVTLLLEHVIMVQSAFFVITQTLANSVLSVSDSQLEE